MHDLASLFSVETIENGFLVSYSALEKVKVRGQGMPMGSLPPSDGADEQTVVVRKRKFCKTEDDVAALAKTICTQAWKIKAFLDERGNMPGMFTQI